ncbi:aldolase/citrate lyase family protein [Danxiaibacter flavus]|uniref:Aldolase/citrate lyase family protein n=1 Tax=Danxiaibacter flavus TaxID=3049108 RepID=A0ABV3Z826_9BACT|nr:aldolase/citrate lyase family protein [Chitinophagaceae bacterium DXS]
MKNISPDWSLKKKLQNRQLTIGSWLTIPHQSVVEIMATAGFEWLTLDLEHAAIDISQVMNLTAIIQGKGMKALARVSKNEEVIIKRVLDAGVDGVIVPTVKNAEEAKMAVEFVKYPPVGKRGVGLNRAQNYGIAFDEYKDWLTNEAVVIAQIEHIEAVQNLEEIVAVEGIDGIIVGPYDLSASMGMPGNYEHPDVQKALARVDEVMLKSGKPLGFHVIQSDYNKVMEKVNKGYTFLAFSIDFFFLGDKAREQMALLKQSV